ncbi:MAG TPA: helix-turn-helix transcriptional regulator [Streptosporangiaceae bacterium]|jgi:transcriptional regulator with XRE-family HTH domain
MTGTLAMPDGAVTKAARRGRLARRQALGMTQEQLAEKLSVERTTVVRWERGETQPLPSIQPRLAKGLKISADQLRGAARRRANNPEWRGDDGATAAARRRG